MSDTAKVITLIGSSPESFAKAADAAVQEAAKTLRGISGAQVVSMSAVVENDRISQYRTTVNIAFAVERQKRGCKPGSPVRPASVQARDSERRSGRRQLARRLAVEVVVSLPPGKARRSRPS